MKKLLITTMAAVSVGLYAKAADAIDASTFTENGTSFDDLTTGADFVGDNDFWQTPEGEGDLFKIIDVVYPQDAIPQHWNLTTGEKALSIDTANPILRNVNPIDGVSGKNEAQGVSPDPVFFDSVVQFTATDVAPSMENNTTDKLAVWLYSTPEDTEGRLFGEDDAVTNLVITAGYYDGNTLKTTNYFTNVAIEPDTWHRLTIKSFKNNNSDLVFNIWVDKTQVAVDGATDFLSRISDKVETNIPYDQLQGVAFDGKGAVDDIVFTTTPPEFAGEDGADDPKVFALNLSISADEDAEATVLTVYADGEEAFPEDDGSRKLNVGTENALAWVSCAEGYKVINEGATYDEEGGYWIVPINVAGATENGTVNVTITVEKAGGGSGEEPEDPEVPAKPTIGGAAVETAEAFIAAANSGATIKVPADWTLVDNTLKDAKGEEYATFAEYYTVTLASDGTGTITLELNNKAEPTIDETAADKGDAIVVTDVAVALGVTNAKVGLWYGAQAYSDAACAENDKLGEPTGWVKASGDTDTVTVTVKKPDVGTAFFKVVVDDQDHTPPPAVEQE